MTLTTDLPEDPLFLARNSSKGAVSAACCSSPDPFPASHSPHIPQALALLQLLSLRGSFKLVGSGSNICLLISSPNCCHHHFWIPCGGRMQSSQVRVPWKGGCRKVDSLFPAFQWPIIQGLQLSKGCPRRRGGWRQEGLSRVDLPHHTFLLALSRQNVQQGLCGSGLQRWLGHLLHPRVAEGTRL